MSQPQNQTWQTIQAELIRRISTRVWQPGDLVPKETDLAIEFGCARGTINRAMCELASAGLIDRKKKAGTRVSHNPARKARLDIPVIRLDVENRGAAYRYVLLGRQLELAPTLVADKLGLPVKTQMLHLRSLHFADNRPFLLEDRWVNPIAVPDILDVDLSKISANEWLVNNAPLTTGDITFSAANADETEAELLETSADTALFVIERSTWVTSLPVTDVRIVYAPGFQMHTRL